MEELLARLREVGRVISAVNETKIKAAITALENVLSMNAGGASEAESAIAQAVEVLAEVEEADLSEIVRQEGSKWVLYTSDGKKKLGEYGTKEEALKRERQIQFFKHQESTDLQEPYPNEHAARVRDPGDFQANSFKSVALPKSKGGKGGVRMVIGRLKGQTTTTAQTYRFPADLYTAAEAKAWLKDNEVKYISFEQATGAKEMQEAGDESHEELRKKLSLALRDRMGLGSASEGPWVRDVYDDYLIYDFGAKTYQLDYTEDANGNITIGDATEVVARTVYEPVAESFGGDVIPLAEKALGEDGTIDLRIIQPGWGSSGYYSKEMLKRDAGIYKPGTKMYWDHPTESEDRERPERSLRDLAGELVTGGAYKEGLNGPGVYAKAKVFSPYKEVLEELAPHIGVSHRALGKAVQGEAEGKKGPIIEKLVAAKSVDYITTPGAGGKVVQLFEAAREKALDINWSSLTTESLERNRPDIVDEIKTSKEAQIMSEEELKELKETGQKLTEENARLKESAILREARDIVTEKVGKAELPDITKERLVENLVKSPPMKEGELDREEFVKDIDEAVTSESDYIAKVTKSGEIRGMGSSESKGNLKESFKASFLRAGKSEEEAEKMAEIAATGR